MTNNGHRTAISRQRLSTPMSFLFCSGFLNRPQRVLDYGCGRGDDVKNLRALVSIQGFDPHFYPTLPEQENGFDVITCNFVLNVIPDEVERLGVIAHISALLSENGVAYISVRNDRKKLNGWTSKGTWQGFIELDLPVVQKTAEFVMYKLQK